MVNDSASGGIGKEGLSIVDSEAEAKQITSSGPHRCISLSMSIDEITKSAVITEQLGQSAPLAAEKLR